MSLDNLDPYDGAWHFDALCARQMEAARLLYENGCVTWPAEVASYVEQIECHAGDGTLAQWCREMDRRNAEAYESGHPGVWWPAYEMEIGKAIGWPAPTAREWRERLQADAAEETE